MKPIIKIMSIAGLLLGFLSGCQQAPDPESEFILEAGSFNQEDTAIANQFGYSVHCTRFALRENGNL